jgi:hypothetical protein
MYVSSSFLFFQGAGLRREEIRDERGGMREKPE